MELEVVWRGDSWRDFPVPVVGTVPSPPEPVRKHVISTSDARQRVLAAVPDRPVSIAMVSERAGIVYSRTWVWLRRLVAEGVVEETTTEADRRLPRQRGTVVRWYRRVPR